MTRVINFPNGENNDQPKGDQVRVKREYCRTCQSGLDLWTDDDGTAYGVCILCDFEIGKHPIVLVSGGEE